MLTAELTSQEDMSPWKTGASQNILSKAVTALTSQDNILPLKLVALSNIEPMFLTEVVFQADRSALKATAFSFKVYDENNLFILSTRLTSQADISTHPAGPHLALAGSSQSGSTSGPQHKRPLGSASTHRSTALNSDSL